MGKYNCEKCGKEFNQKSHYTTHTNKKIRVWLKVK